MKNLGSWRRFQIVLASIVSLTLVSYADYLTGLEVLFFLFYFAPVSLCGWFLGWRSTLAMAILSGISWYLVDRISGHLYVHAGIQYWNSIICFVAFAAVGLIVVRLRSINAEQERISKELVKALEDLSRSTEEMRKLQNKLQVVCAWTKRIRVGNEWVDVDRFLAEKLLIPISHGISPEALEELKKRIESEGLGSDPKGASNPSI